MDSDLNPAIEELARSAETCEHNAPLHEAEGNAEQAALCRQLAASYRAGEVRLRECAQALGA